MNTVQPLGPITLYWGRSNLPDIGPIRLYRQFGQVSFRGRYFGMAWR